MLTLAAGLGFLARGRSLAEGYLIVGPALVLLAGLGAWACWSRAGQSPEEARGWRWLALSYLAGGLQGIFVALVPRLTWAEGSRNAVWFLLALVYQVAGVAGVAQWPWRLRNEHRRLLHVLGSTLFCGSLVLMMWGSINWGPVLGETHFLSAILLSNSLRVALFGGLALYLLTDRPARWRGPLGWLLLNAVLGGAFLGLLNAFWAQGITWLLPSVLALPLVANSMMILAAFGRQPVEPLQETIDREAPFWTFLPDAAFLLAALQVTFQVLRTPQVGRWGVPGLVLLLIPLLWRQALIFREVHRAQATLEDRVEVRTRDLEAATARLEQEVAHRTRSEEALRASTVMYRELLDCQGEGFALVDAQERFRVVNPVAERIFGTAPGTLVGRSLLEFVPPDQEDLVRAESLFRSQGNASTYELQIVRDDGVRRTLLLTATPRPGRTGEKHHAIGVFRDITEQREVQALFRKNEEQYRYILENLNEIIMMVDNDDCILYVNHKFQELLGWAPDEVLGRVGHELLLDPKDHALILRTNAERRKEVNSQYEVEFIAKDGRRIPFLVSGSPLFDADMQVVGSVGALTDLSDRRQLFHAQKLESLGSLAGGVAHDMNNVLGAILVTASTHLAEQPPGGSTHRALETIAKAATRGGQMVRSLLNFARRSPVVEADVDLNAVLQEVVQLLERTTLAKIRLSIDLEPGLPLIRGDASTLTHSFMNLCVNAVDAMPGDGTLTLRTRTLDDGQVEALVADTGTGMTPEVLARALDPFFTTKEAGKGTGLGLAMVYGIVTAHRGLLQLQSRPGEGTRATIRFPACAPALPPLPGSPAHAQGETALAASDATRSGLMVLLVDDDDDIRCAMQDLLDTLGHRNAGAACGEDALRALEEGLQPDAVILDMNMPGLGGAGTLPRLRTLRPSVPVLLVTGDADQAALDLTATYPGVHLLAKPFTFKDLQRELGAMLFV